MRVLNFVRLVAAMAVVVAVASGCDRGEQYGTATGPSATPSVSAVPTPPPSHAALDPARQAVVDRYLLYVRTLEKLYETTDPSQVDMAAVSTGAQFRHVVELALQMQGRHEFARGHFDDDISRVEIKGGNAKISTCQDGNGVRTYDRISGKEKYPGKVFPKRAQIVSLGFESGKWKTASIANTGLC
ncbi:MAG: hypothetical protein QOD41_2283 [Cryptosporangiaceae bacterium]|nr:hypothetical protein [Cryptosporangiaceae bacterium]